MCNVQLCGLEIVVVPRSSSIVLPTITSPPRTSASATPGPRSPRCRAARAGTGRGGAPGPARCRDGGVRARRPGWSGGTYVDPQAGRLPFATHAADWRDFAFSNFNAFAQLYGALDELTTFDEDNQVSDISEIRKNQMLEITGDFTKSPVNDMLDQVFQLADMMQRMPDQDKNI